MGRVLPPRNSFGRPLAPAASILTAIYHMLKDGTQHQDLGAHHFDRRSKDLKVKRLVTQLANLSFNKKLSPWPKPYDTMDAANLEPAQQPGLPAESLILAVLAAPPGDCGLSVRTSFLTVHCTSDGNDVSESIQARRAAVMPPRNHIQRPSDTIHVPS